MNTGAETGKFNMDLDLFLAKKLKADEACLRLYQWKPYCISLGANQNIDSINLEAAKKDNIDVVFRPTGGRAILHSEELTYSVILPLNSTSSAKEIYQNINLALAEGLKRYDEKLNLIKLETKQPNFSLLYKEEKSALCFAVPAKSELKFKGKKLAGSAQRKFNNALLQHGSILCGTYHRNIVKYLNIDENYLSKIKRDLDQTTTELNTILNKVIDYTRLAYSIRNSFSSFFNCIFEEIDLESFLEQSGVSNYNIYLTQN